MKDLVKLYSIYSVSGTEGEKEICDWICSWLDDRKVPYTRDGNTLYSISSASAVMLSAHLDQVKTNGRAAHIYKDDCNTIIAYNDKWQRTSLGADDKNGVWLILKLLEDGWIFDWVISESEEVGCVGIKKIEQELKKTLADFCIVLDRRGNYDILNKGAGTNYCEALAYNLKNFFNDGSVVTTGSVSDTQVICKYIEAVNMSVAYHNPHTATEETDYERLLQIKDNLTCLFTENFTHYTAHPQDYNSTRGGY